MSNQNETKTGQLGQNLPVLTGPVSARPNVGRYSLPASFASQLIAARDRLGVQRTRRVTSASLASNAYVSGGKIAVKRMPNGYVRTLVV